MPYPNLTDYTASVENAASQVVDPVLKNAKPRLRNNRAEKRSGGMAVVFPFQAGTSTYAVKCWTRDLGDMRLHYKLVDAFLKTADLKCFVKFGFVERGIIANGSFWPILRMEWVGGNSLLKFVDQHHSDGTNLKLLSERYLTMSQALHQCGVAHGDLQGSNMNVEGSGSGLEIKLIDYDTLVIPAYHGKAAQAIALPSYQHPRRKASPRYTGKEDYFSELVIYLSLLAVAEKPSLWRRYPKGGPELAEKDRHDKDMLFVVEDFTASKPTEVFKELFNLSPLVKRLTLILWNYTRASSIEQLLPLEEAVKLAKQSDALRSHARAKTEFERMLEASTTGTGNWLDDSAFVSLAQTGGSIRTASSSDSVGKNFDHWLRDLTPSVSTSGQNGAPQNNQAPVQTFASGLWVVGVLAFLILLPLFFQPDSGTATMGSSSWREDSGMDVVPVERSEKKESQDANATVAGKINLDTAGYAAAKDLIPTIQTKLPPNVPIRNVPSDAPLPSVPIPDVPSQSNKPIQPDFSIYDASLLRFLRSEHPIWMAGLKQIPRPKYLGKLGMEQYLAVKFVEPYSPGMTSPSQWYAQVRVRDGAWQALSPAESYQTKGAVVADFCVRHPASLTTIGGVITTYIESLNSRRVTDLLTIYSEDAIWVDRGSSTSDRSVLEGNLWRTYQEWPRSRVDVSTEPEIVKGDTDDTVSVQFRTRFRMEDKVSGKWSEGTRSTQWRMIKINGWHVVREETALVTPPYDGALSKAERESVANRTRISGVPAASRPVQTRPTSPPRLRVINVTADDWLALRMIPDARAQMLANIPHDATGIEKTGESQMNGGDIWVPVRWNGINGWAHGDFLDYE